MKTVTDVRKKLRETGIKVKVDLPTDFGVIPIETKKKEAKRLLEEHGLTGPLRFIEDNATGNLIITSAR